jgi:predicted Zn-ribbon and HTH transcriptional regulator
MPRCRPEVADVFREHGAEFIETSGDSISVEQRRVLRDISRCRTAALGGHRQRCDHCGHEDISYNSCRNRHCPKCQASTRAEWLEKEASNLLDVPYFHVVFTLPEEVGPLALQNRRAVYGALFHAAADTLSTIARDLKHLGAEIGYLMVLHTWGQNLLHHPHLHCVVPGGGISPDGSRWIPCRAGFFLPVRVLSQLFRGKFIALLDGLHEKGKLSFFGQLTALRDRPAWEAFLAPLREMEWVVYSKPPFGGARQVLKYLARYTHRVAISNRRILSISGGKVRFRWKDYAHDSKQRMMELSAHEFIRRFLLHVIPPGFVRVRHYGFLANRLRTKKLELARKLLVQCSAEAGSASVVGSGDSTGLEKVADPFLCPRCKQGRFVIVGDIRPVVNGPASMEIFDTT